MTPSRRSRRTAARSYSVRTEMVAEFTSCRLSAESPDSLREMGAGLAFRPTEGRSPISAAAGPCVSRLRKGAVKRSCLDASVQSGPIWSPDGRHLLVLVSDLDSGRYSDGWEWLVIPF